jgi:uncharacterized membrane protein YqiK
MSSFTLALVSPLLADVETPPWLQGVGLALLVLLGALLMIEVCGLRFIPNDQVGVVEKRWSPKGSVTEGRIIALSGEAGYQADILRGGIHFGLWRIMYRIHKVPLVTVSQGQLGYVYARDGESLQPSQTLGRVVDSNNFQDARAFLLDVGNRESAGDAPVRESDGQDFRCGQRGRQRIILREGVYAINLALFVVITEDRVYRLSLSGRQELKELLAWQEQLRDIDGFHPVVIGQTVDAPDPLRPDQSMKVDTIGIVTVHDGPSLPPGEIIAPDVGNSANDPNYHNNFQDPEAFLRSGGRRGRQYTALTDGTYFINRWFATVEIKPKTVVPIGYVGVVVSYIGRAGRDLSGTAFRHGERVAEGERGVWEKPLGPGKYPFNAYAGNLILVPTTNFVLHWITGKTEAHRYDESLRSIDLVTRDAYEPLLPLSVVVHIDYQKAPGVIQRFGDVKKLITQTLDPMLSAYFRDVAHKKTMLQLLQDRDAIQQESRQQLQEKFGDFDIECVDVLIGKPASVEGDTKIENLLEQLRQRQLSTEQVETYEKQRVAAEKLKGLQEAQAIANKQAELTNSQIQVRIIENEGEAELARSRKQAEQTIVTAQADNQKRIIQADADLARAKRQAEQTVMLAEADSKQKVLAGRGEGAQRLQVGLSEVAVLLRKIGSFGDPRLYALTQAAEHLSKSQQPLVPEKMFIAGGGSNGDGAGPQNGLLGTLISLLVAEKSGFSPADGEGMATIKEFAEKMAVEAMQQVQQAAMSPEVASTAIGAGTK